VAKSDILGIKSEVLGIKSGYGTLSDQVFWTFGVKSDILGIKMRVLGIKSDILDIKTRFLDIKSGFGTLSDQVLDTFGRFSSGFRKVSGQKVTFWTLFGCGRSSHRRFLMIFDPLETPALDVLWVWGMV
jgi:hypothetical protein